MASTVVLKAAGLYTSPNQLSLPDGALSEASNVLIRRDGIVEQRRGFKLYGNSSGSSSQRFKQLTTYRNRILRHISDTLQYDSDGKGLFQTFSGNYTEPSDLLRMKFIESNGNLYFTSSNGIQKLSSKTADGLSNATITKAGAAKAISVEGKILYSANQTNGFLPQDSAVAYRVLWGYKDANDNFIAGAPSQRELVYYYQLNYMLLDYMRLLGTLDSFSNTPLTTARINDKNYVSTVGVTASSSLSDLRTKLISLCSKIDNDILYADTAAAPLTITTSTITSGICTVNFTGTVTDYLSAASSVFLAGFGVTGTGDINGVQTVISATINSITFATTATGTVSTTGSSIVSNEFRVTLQPPAPENPPIHLDNSTVQAYFLSILAKLRALPDAVITAADQLILDTVDITTTANVELTIAIPQDIDSNYFYQLYRSSIFTAPDSLGLADITPNDELQLVYEAYPTVTELAAGTLQITDVTPDDFKGANLYTNNSTGEGILQANEIPPFALDINRYRDVVFYANTRTKHRLAFNLLGVQAMLADYALGETPSITIATINGANTYKFVTGLQEISTITTVADVADSLNGSYFLIQSAKGSKYCVYFKTSGGVDSPPVVAEYTNIQISINTNASANIVAQSINDKLSIYLEDFSSLVLSNVATVMNVDFGSVGDIVDGAVTTGFTFAITQQGRGEDIANKQVLLSNNASPAIAVDETARSLIRNINQNSNESIYAYYLSSAFDVPGKMLFEAKDLQVTDEFFIQANNNNTGLAFNPGVSPDFQISSITTGANPVITTTTNHGLLNRDFVVLGNTDSTPSVDGIYEITYISSNSFSISEVVTVAGTKGAVTPTTNSITSENEVRPNRIYYSKSFQPEAVPISNYFNVGAEDKQILRIFPLRDSLFVFKEDGLYRISGDSAPFQLNLFDSSFIVTAPDSVTVINNVIFGWTNQGIQSLTEGGAQVVSRPIDNQILRLGSNNYTNFKTATWAVGYESDNSYLVFTVTDFEDTIATKAFRFSTLTQSWTTYDKTNTCGIVKGDDDRLYLAAGDTNFIEQERKSFDRTDYADREINAAFDNSFLINPNVVKLNSITGYKIGDVLVQNQTVTGYEFNIILEKLDSDSSVNDSTFLSTLQFVDGDNLRFKLISLAQKLDLNPNIVASNFESTIADYSGTATNISAQTATQITSPSHGLVTGRVVLITGSDSTPSINGEYVVTVIDSNTFSIPVDVKIPGTTASWQTSGQDFADIKTCYNKIMTSLNNDNGVSFNNYKLNNTETPNEAIIIGINSITKQLTLNLALNWMVGDITIYKAISSTITYSPITMGDPLMIKHLRESTLMLETRNITQGTLSFATDLLPELIPVPFSLDGNGIFGHSNFGSGLFGGLASSAPFRTFIPRQCQRCRFIVVKYDHAIAREDYRLLGVTITGETGQSTRGYR